MWEAFHRPGEKIRSEIVGQRQMHNIQRMKTLDEIRKKSRVITNLSLESIEEKEKSMRVIATMLLLLVQAFERILLNHFRQLMIDSVQFIPFVRDLLMNARENFLVRSFRLFDFRLEFLLQEIQMNIDRFTLNVNQRCEQEKWHTLSQRTQIIASRTEANCVCSFDDRRERTSRLLSSRRTRSLAHSLWMLSRWTNLKAISEEWERDATVATVWWSPNWFWWEHPHRHRWSLTFVRDRLSLVYWNENAHDDEKTLRKARNTWDGWSVAESMYSSLSKDRSSWWVADSFSQAKSSCWSIQRSELEICEQSHSDELQAVRVNFGLSFPCSTWIDAVAPSVARVPEGRLKVVDRFLVDCPAKRWDDVHRESLCQRDVIHWRRDPIDPNAPKRFRVDEERCAVLFDLVESEHSCVAPNGQDGVLSVQQSSTFLWPFYIVQHSNRSVHFHLNSMDITWHDLSGDNDE